MQAYETNDVPKFNPMAIDGVQPQADDELVTSVLVSGEWIPCLPGSFKYLIAMPNPNDKKKVIPYIQFDVPPDGYDGYFMHSLSGMRVQVFPQSG